VRRRAVFAALLLIGLGVALGATVFRADIARATGLAHNDGHADLNASGFYGS
jgi:hypothetical protein